MARATRVVQAPSARVSAGVAGLPISEQWAEYARGRAYTASASCDSGAGILRGGGTRRGKREQRPTPRARPQRSQPEGRRAGGRRSWGCSRSRRRSAWSWAKRPLSCRRGCVLSGRGCRAETHQRTTLKCVRSEPALPQLTWIGHLPSVVFPPTIHVHDTRPWKGSFGLRPLACERPIL